MKKLSSLKKDFPVFDKKNQKIPLAYFDNASTTQKPKVVLDKMNEVYEKYYANIHRGVYQASQKATEEYEKSRVICQKFINAALAEEIIFTHGTTDSINLVAHCLGESYLHPGDEIIISEIEHHANFVPWQMLAEKKSLVLKLAPVNERGDLVVSELEKLISKKTKLIALTHISNVLGNIFPIKKIAKIAHKNGALVLVDGAQAIGHKEIDVRDLDCDFYCFSGHKMYGPTGIGILYGKKELLEMLPPYQTGGNMIEEVSIEKTTFAKSPAKFEAGTPPIVEAIGLGSAIKYLEKIGMKNIDKQEQELTAYATRKLKTIPGLKIVGKDGNKSAIISFTMDDIHPHDLGTVIDSSQIAIRTGHHCSQPTMKRFGIVATNRISFAIYNNKNEIDELIKKLRKAKKILL